MLETKNIEIYYGKIMVVRGLSLRVERGEIRAILGANGAGKSTTLKTIMGYLDDQPDKGTIWFNGKRIDGLETEQIVPLGIAYVPEGREVFPELTLKENLMMGAYTRRDKSVSEDLDRVFIYFPLLKERLKQQAGTLSGGEQQMLAIGRALMSKPSLMMMDEPSLGLSPILVTEIFEIVRAINRDGATILLVEQNAHKALSVAHHAYIMETGRIVMEGPPEKLMNDEDVQEFYLGIRKEEAVRGEARYKRKKRWR
ncbi:MAG: ABC transporter ATP-binding protein [Deltaproteobacteria bacterium]|nr:ABC transporter ATP-binding protein [Deltaproteobacteria bacterium]